jgi:hypothetical protein
MRALRPKALTEFGPWGETKIYEFIKRGLLPPPARSTERPS